MSASSAGGMAARRTPQRSDGLVVKACAVSTKRQLHRFGIARLQRLCSTCAESRLQQPRWSEARTLCSYNSIMRDQEMRPPTVQASSGTTAQQCNQERGSASAARPSLSLDSRRMNPTRLLRFLQKRIFQALCCNVVCVRVPIMAKFSSFWVQKNQHLRNEIEGELAAGLGRSTPEQR